MSAVLRDSWPWRQFICRACGYIYDEKDGDPDGGLAPGTRYEDIPDDWACPLCGVSKDDFDPYTAPSAGTAVRDERAPLSLPRRGRKPVVIVGGGLAGWSVARALRARDPTLTIVLVAADAADVYPKPALSLAFGRRRTARDLIEMHGAEAARQLGIQLVAHAHAIGIDATRRRLRTTRGTFDYAALVLATGATPVASDRLPADLCWRVNALETWTRLDAVLARGVQRVAVIGAGLVGCEMADDLAHAGHKVTVLDPAPRPLMAWATVDESQRLLDAWTGLDVRFFGSSPIASVTRPAHAAPIVVRTIDGARIEADVVIAAIGLATDRRLARMAGLGFDVGIQVDPATHATTVDSIYAAGDCVSIDGKPCRFIEPIARQAATIAGALVDRTRATDLHRAPLVRFKARSAAMTLGARDS